MIRVLMLFFCSAVLFGCQQPSNNEQILTSGASYTATLSDDASLAIVSTETEGAQLWNLTDHKQMYRWFHHQQDNTNNIIHTAISSNNQYAATLSKASLSVWRISDGESMGWWSLSSNGQSVSIADNGQALVGLVDGSVMSLLLDQKRLIQFLGHKEKVNDVALSSDGKFALSGANDGNVMLWEAQTGQPIHQWTMESRITNVTLNHSGSMAFASNITGKAKIWRADTGKQHSELDINRRQMNVSSARFIANDSQLVIGTPSKEIFLWNVANGKQLNRWQVQLTKNSQNRGAVVYSVAFKAPNEIISISSQGLLETWPITNK